MWFLGLFCSVQVLLLSSPPWALSAFQPGLTPVTCGSLRRIGCAVECLESALSEQHSPREPSVFSEGPKHWGVGLRFLGQRAVRVRDTSGAARKRLCLRSIQSPPALLLVHGGAGLHPCLDAASCSPQFTGPALPARAEDAAKALILPLDSLHGFQPYREDLALTYGTGIASH